LGFGFSFGFRFRFRFLVFDLFLFSTFCFLVSSFEFNQKKGELNGKGKREPENCP